MNPIVVVAGTRPEHLKVAEVIRELRGCGRKVRYVWTGQHTSPSLAADVFAATDGPYPDVVLPWPAVKARSGRSPRVGADKPPQLVWAAALWSASAIEPHLADAALVLVQGDTASALAGALAAKRVGGLPLAHLEAGLRSYDWTMPEEHVRVAIDAEADLLLCPSPLAAATCRIERAALTAKRGRRGAARIAHVGQTGIDSLVRAATADRDWPSFRAGIEALFAADEGRWALVTLHRAALTDDPALLRATVASIAGACVEAGYRPVWATHPRVTGNPGHAKALSAFLALGGRVIDPLGYRTLAALLLARDGRGEVSGFADRAIVVTDSGGLAEDAAYARVPVVIVRPTTERQELLAAFPWRVGIAAPGWDDSAMRGAVKDAVAATRGYAPIPPEYGYRDFLGVAPYPYAPPLVANLTGELSASATTALAISDYLTAGYKAD
jgi:UDP-N-acetylglucosamine 2-epimerase (non-hydrolysing)